MSGNLLDVDQLLDASPGIHFVAIPTDQSAVPTLVRKTSDGQCHVLSSNVGPRRRQDAQSTSAVAT